ncbi:GNAT family N-acetyltransferase [Paenibacillus rhizoplanae]
MRGTLTVKSLVKISAREPYLSAWSMRRLPEFLCWMRTRRSNMQALNGNSSRGPHLIMHRLAVHPEIQGKGIARRLIAFAEEFARSSGYRSIRLDTYAKNDRVLKLYPSLGYLQRGEIRFPGRTAAFSGV